MLYRFTRATVAVLIAISMFATAPVFALNRNSEVVRFDEDDKKKKDKDKDKKEDKSEGKEKMTKQERQYQQVKKYSNELYGKDDEFRAEVTEAYREKQREHVEFAFSINTRDREDAQSTHKGDKLKVEDALYDNPMVQDYVNRVGQSLVPQSSTKLYAFKVTLNPIPEARSLSTGTVYISSGFLAMVDNEAQLSYVLGHEIAHIERDHWFEDAMVAQGMERYNEKQQKKRALIGIATGAILGGLTKSQEGLLVGFILAPTVLKFMIPDATCSWDQAQEDEADQLSLKYMLERNYDPREVPRIYASLQQALKDDPRIGLGFIASSPRVNERTQLLGSYLPMSKAIAPPSAAEPNKTTAPGKGFEVAQDPAQRAGKAEDSISGGLAKQIADKLAAGGLIGSSPDFEAVMAELKRDNGVRAFYYDMFRMARSNLEESLRIRSNDPLAHLYYGKVLKLTARNQAEKSRALAEFVRAIDLDKRQVLPDARLHRALALMEAKDPALTKDIVANLKEYVELFQRESAGGLPPNMDVIYDYMQEAGEMNWAASPAMNVSTKNIAPITTADSGSAQSNQPQPEAAKKPAATGRRQ